MKKLFFLTFLLFLFLNKVHSISAHKIVNQAIAREIQRLQQKYPDFIDPQTALKMLDMHQERATLIEKAKKKLKTSIEASNKIILSIDSDKYNNECSSYKEPLFHNNQNSSPCNVIKRQFKNAILIKKMAIETFNAKQEEIAEHINKKYSSEVLIIKQVTAKDNEEKEAKENEEKEALNNFVAQIKKQQAKAQLQQMQPFSQKTRRRPNI